MATIESKQVVLNTTPDEVFGYVKNLNNLIDLLPADKVSEWQGEEGKCAFKVAGGYKIGLEHKSLTEPSSIVLRSSEGSAMKFDLDIRLQGEGDKTRAGMVANVDANPFVMMMVEKPLKNLFDYIATKMEAKYA
ncbi:MAG: hypothetical protein ACFCUH_06020 [Flavobacteriales bacterium]